VNRDPTKLTDFKTAGELLETVAIRQETIKTTARFLLQEADQPERIEALSLLLAAYLEEGSWWLSQLHQKYGGNLLVQDD